MFYEKLILEALKRSWAIDANPLIKPDRCACDQDCVTSKLIYDVFGGEILKTTSRKGWHFYNRINGERIDFTVSEDDNSLEIYHFEDIPSSSDETDIYFEQEDYSTFFMKFVRAFEEVVGLDKIRPGFSA